MYVYMQACMQVGRYVRRYIGMYVGRYAYVSLYVCGQGGDTMGGWVAGGRDHLHKYYVYKYIYYDYRNMLHDRQHMVYMVQDRGAKLLGEFLSVFSLGLRIGQENMFAACAKKLQLVTTVGFLQGWFGAYSRLVQNIVMVGLGVVERLGLLWDSCRCKGYARLGFGFMKAGYGFI